MDTISKTSSVKKPSTPRSRSKKATPVAPEYCHQMIAEAAYYHAEARGFQGGHEIDDWLEAEAKIGSVLKKA